MIEPTVPTNQGPKTPTQIVSDLTYINYAHNRRMSPHITPEQWAQIYGPSTPAMEERFQKEA